MCLLRFTKVFIIWTKQAFLGIWEVLPYSITWIPWRLILVNINFYVIQFPLISVFLDRKMKIYLLDIFLFLLFAKTIPQKAKICRQNIDRSFIVWVTFKYFIGGNFAEENFSTQKNEENCKNFHHFFPSVFFPINILVFSILIKMYTVKQ